MKKYDVIIVNYYGEKIIGDCLDSLYKSSILPEKVIIYDNASQDKSIEIIKKNFPGVTLIEGRDNLGFGRANNEAMKYSKAEFILFLNNDVVLDAKCAEALINGFGVGELAVLNPLIYKGWDRKNTTEIYSFGAEMNRSGFGYSLYDIQHNRNDLSCFSGACFMAKSDVIKSIKFENIFFLYYEEPDISTKLLIGGYKIGRTSEAKCYHLENYSSPKKKSDGICFRQFFAIQNRWYMLGKYWPTSLLVSAMPANLMHLFYNLFFFAKSKRYKELRIVYLSFSRLFQGRKLYRKQKNSYWTKQLGNSGLFSMIGLGRKVYR